MKKLIWALRLGIVLFGVALVWEQVQYNRQVASGQRISQQRQSPHREANHLKIVRPRQLSDFSATKVEAAQVWFHVKGPRVIDEDIPLHIRQIAAGQRIQPENPRSAVYNKPMIQVYSDDHQDMNNRVTYAHNADNTVMITPMESSPAKSQAVRVNTQASPKHRTTLLKVVQLII
ncbi:hypothetical protein [Lactiplantibacillus pentosus]|uniref:hypothetical protein n=1 Tax=Lactiplantibacillus pentosus TaxID=1589 RepID=UPI002079A06C|nr:hypothetical protein [Lactiplantibacillus pentosus]USJ86502.1 hypothetical protein KSF55_01180 [Lactiplantibacillus pentosus]